MVKLAALVPLRGGSKSIPEKNIRLLAGKPLCAWVLGAAHASGIFDAIHVSTDSPVIADVVRSLDLPVNIIDRPADLATDTASTESVMLHAAELVPFEILVTIQATSPMVQPDDFVRAYEQFVRESCDSMLTAIRVKRFYWSDGGRALNYDPVARPRRQDFSGSLMENGSFYFTSRATLLAGSCRLGGKIGIYEMEEQTGVEIDEPADWLVVEKLILQKQRKELQSFLSQIKLLVVDVDGTMTDAGMYYSSKGDFLKKFNTRDAKGLELVRACGVEVAIITTEETEIVTARARKLGITRCHIGVRDKISLLRSLCEELQISLSEVAYIGDDINDAACLAAVGFSACPADAVPVVREAVHYVATSGGGNGAVREICDLMIEAIK